MGNETERDEGERRREEAKLTAKSFHFQNGYSRIGFVGLVLLLDAQKYVSGDDAWRVTMVKIGNKARHKRG